jgi:asparagine synthase (glutamine-hydrolysing)
MLLRDADVFSMVHPLELRAPLLDHRVVELAARCPGAWKHPDPRAKPLLLDAVGQRLPRRAYASAKRGFSFPWDAWLRGPVRARADETMADRALWKSLCFRPDAPTELWQRFISNDRSVAALQVLALLVLADYTARHCLRCEA